MTSAGSVSLRAVGERLRWLAAPLALLLVGAQALGQAQTHPLKPPDRSSPRAALQTFLESGDKVAASLANDYLPDQSREKFNRLISLIQTPMQSLDLSEVPPAARERAGRAAALVLYEVLSRIPLPPADEIPGAEAVTPSGDSLKRWVIPNTDIALARAADGPRAGEFLFSADTVGRTEEYYALVRGLPYIRPVPIEGLVDLAAVGGGWMIPYRWILSLPPLLRVQIAQQAAWKWIGLAGVLAGFALFLWLAYRVSRLFSERQPFLRALAQFALPVFLLAAAPAVAYLLVVQVNLVRGAGSMVELAATAVTFLAAAWMAWRFAPVLAEAIIASPSIAPESIDAHLIRMGARILGIVSSATLLALGADRLGIPVYGIVAGLGVGGLAIALAAQGTLENLIGGMNLFADKPIRVGDVCKYGDQVGTVEAIGIRSARIRGTDRALTTIPNAALAKMPIVNYTQRDRMLINAMINLRYETTPEQLRYVLVKLRELLLGHPRISPDPARVRFVGFGASSLDLELFAYVTTGDGAEFLGIREDILLRVMDVVEEAGTSFALPSQTLYLGRDRGSDGGRTEKAEAQVRAWREEGALPFPNFSPEQAARIRGALDFPPAGSP